MNTRDSVDGWNETACSHSLHRQHAVTIRTAIRWLHTKKNVYIQTSRETNYKCSARFVFVYFLTNSFILYIYWIFKKNV